MLEWLFIISMLLPTFGGPVHLTFETTTEEGCLKLRKVVVKEMDGMRFQYQVSECHQQSRLPTEPR